MEFHHVGQVGLVLLTSSNPLASASRSARIIGVSHCAQPLNPFSKFKFKTFYATTLHLQRVDDGGSSSSSSESSNTKETGQRLQQMREELSQVNHTETDNPSNR
ncbi:hypothetical protein AAY473_040260 [Plecturocebus cupreus]